MKTVLRSFRVSPGIDKLLQALAKYEDRTVSKIIQRIMNQAVIEYANKDENFWEAYNHSDDFLEIRYGLSKEAADEIRKPV